MTKLVAIKDAMTATIPNDVRDAVLKILNTNRPFYMIAQRPDGQWETSCWYRYSMVSSYEVAGVLHQAQNRLIEGDEE